MKIWTKKPFVLSVLIAGFGCMFAGRVTAQTFTNLHSFPNEVFPTDPIGEPVGPPIILGDTNSGLESYPAVGLVLSGNTLYGTTQGGSSASGVFAVNTDGTGFRMVHGLPITIQDGAGGAGTGLTISDNTLYGAAGIGYLAGGILATSSVFKVNADGSGFAILHDLAGGTTNTYGAFGGRGLVLTSNTLYGATRNGGSSGGGMVFKLNTDGTGFTTLYSFTATDPITGTNSDGSGVTADLALSDNTLYGATYLGGSSGSGTIFKLNSDGSGFATLHTFTPTSPPSQPNGGLLLSGNTLYGTTISGGSSGGGTVFRLNTDGTGFTTLYSFTATDPITGANNDGFSPNGELVLWGNSLFGTATQGGNSGNGTVFAVNTDGTGFTVLHTFSGGGRISYVSYGVPLTIWTNSDGSAPLAGMILSGNTLYGTTWTGGAGDGGTVFSISLLPQLTITPADGTVLVSWPTNNLGFVLETSSSLGASQSWSIFTGPAHVFGDQNVVAADPANRSQFFRLRKP
jgi:uncharacterized repeat protein (TIGR03803 family)